MRNVAKYAGLFLIGVGSAYGLAVILGTLSLKSLDLSVDFYNDLYDL